MKRPSFSRTCDWMHSQVIPAKTYVCGHCGIATSGREQGFQSSNGPHPNPPPQIGNGLIRICNSCGCPTFFDFEDRPHPASSPGDEIEDLPGDLALLYQEARDATAAGAYTAAVMVCRKMLMHVAVAEGDEPGRRFIEYIDYLDSHNFVPPKGKGWVTYIKDRANEANHEIVLMQQEDAEALIKFVAALLRFNYELPAQVPSDASEAKGDGVEC